MLRIKIIRTNAPRSSGPSWLRATVPPAESLAHVAARLGGDHPGRLVYFGGEVFVRSVGAGQSAAPYSGAADPRTSLDYGCITAHISERRPALVSGRAGHG